MISIAGLIRFRMAQTAALVAVLVFACHGALSGTADLGHIIAAAVPSQARLSAAELTPSYTILPAAPTQVAKASQETRPAAASLPVLLPAQAQAALPQSAGAAPRDTSARPAPLLSPPYAARGPPFLS